MKKKGIVTGIIVTAVLLLFLSVFSVLYYTGLSGIRSYGRSTVGIRVACVGDSITYGYGVKNWPERNYPAVLQDLLGPEYIVNNYGVSGYAVQKDSNKPYVSRKEYRSSLEFDPDIVIFMLGSNDSKPANWKGKEKFRKDYISLIESYRDSLIILCTPPKAFPADKTETSFHIQPGVVDEIAETVRETAAELRLPLLDINAITSAHPEWYVSDSVHLNADGAAALARQIEKELRALL